MNEPTQILFVRQKHDAKRAGLHYDYRVVIGDKAFSWASRKEFPESGKPTILWEQPVHDRTYATTPDIVIPEGQYGAGTQVLDYAQKGTAEVHDDSYHLELKNGDRFLIKKAPEHYGEKAWLFLRKKKLEDKKNVYLEKAAALVDKKRDDIHGMKRVGTVVGSSALAFSASVPGQVDLVNKLKSNWKSDKKSPITEADVQSYRKAKNLRHVERFDASSPVHSYYMAPTGKAGGIKKPQVHSSHPEAALHEYGHAHSFNTSRKAFGTKGTSARHTLNLISRKATGKFGMLGGAYAATSDNEKVRKAAPYAVAAGTAPLLVEEARASISPIKHIYKTRGKAAAKHLAKNLAPAFGTYALSAAAAVGGVALAKHFKEKAIKSANPK